MKVPKRIETLTGVIFLTLSALFSNALSAATPLVTLRPSAEDVLVAPTDVEGDFDVAKTPPVIDFAVLPGQWEGAKLWSNWGDSLCGPDGNYYCSIGDHDGPHGHTYVYKVDPRAKTVEQIVDYNKVVGMAKDKYAPGKIHGPIMAGGDGWLYFIGYRARGTTEEYGYRGDWMLRYHVESGKVENVGIPVPYASVPTSKIHLPSRIMYGLTAPGETSPVKHPQFFAYYMDKKTLVFLGGPPSNMPRAIFLTPDGRAYYSYDAAPRPRKPERRRGEKGKTLRPTSTGSIEAYMVRYDPKLNCTQPTKARIPGDGILRAASRIDSNGVGYGITRSGLVFAFDTKTETIRPITQVFVKGPGYTTACRLDPTETYLYYIPSAHGGSRQHGTAVIQLNVKTGRRKVVAFLNDYIRKEENYNLGGTFGLAMNEDGSQLFICWNGKDLPAPEKKADFGLVSVMIIHIPEGER